MKLLKCFIILIIIIVIVAIGVYIYKKRKRERKINMNTSTLNVTQNLGGSFGESFNIFENETDAGFKYKQQRNKVKGYIMNFKEHILNKDHPINIVAQLFESVWVNFAKSKLEFMKNNYGDPNENNRKKICEAPTPHPRESLHNHARNT